jgi:putative endonuclease
MAGARGPGQPVPGASPADRGRAAEAAAADYLARQGLTLLRANYRCRLGEIDLVLRDGATIVFAEVRLRSSRAFGGAAESIDARKRSRVIAAARHYLAGKPEAPCRFDAVLLERLDPPAIEWIRNAFTA